MDLLHSGQAIQTSHDTSVVDNSAAAIPTGILAVSRADLNKIVVNSFGFRFQCCNIIVQALIRADIPGFT